MKNKTLLGVFLAILVMVIAPTIPAQEYKQVKDTYQTKMNETMDEMITILQNIETTERSQMDVEQTIMAIESIIQNIDAINLESKPSSCGFIISTLISLFFALLGTIFGIVFGPILAFIVKLITAPAVFLAKLISFLLGDTEITTI